MRGEMDLQSQRTTMGPENNTLKTRRPTRIKRNEPAHVNSKCTSRFVSKHSSLNIMYTNADQLRNKIQELKAYTQNSEFIPDIIAITEVKPKNNRYPVLPSEYNIENYALYQDNVDNKKGRGIIIYVHESLSAKIISCNTDFEESLWVEIPLIGCDKLLVGCIYRSESGTKENNDRLLHLLNEIKTKKYSHILIMGDFNYKDINWQTWSPNKGNTQSEEFKFIECLRDNYLFQHVNKPTRGRGADTPHLLDLIMTNVEEMITDIDHLSPLGKSDHSVLSLKINCYSRINTYAKQKIYYNKANYEEIKNELNKIDWKTTLDSKDINQQWEIFVTKIKEQIKNYVPQKEITNNTKRKFPLSKQAQETIKNKHKLWKKYLLTKDTTVHKQFCKVRNKVKTITKRAQKQFENSLAKKSKENPKAIWQYIKSKSKIKEGITELNIDPSNEKSTTNE